MTELKEKYRLRNKREKFKDKKKMHLKKQKKTYLKKAKII